MSVMFRLLWKGTGKGGHTGFPRPPRQVLGSIPLSPHALYKENGSRNRVAARINTIVESRCGAVASSDDHTPFPHPAHRTGQADFPHPALGQGSRFLRVTRSATSEHLLGLLGSSPIPRTLV